MVPGVGFEPTKLSHSILSAAPLTTRETWLITKEFGWNGALPTELQRDPLRRDLNPRPPAYNALN